MRKHVFPRIIWLILLNCVIFILLVTMQFTRKGNFSQKIGDMLVSGRYAPEANGELEHRPLNGAAKVIFGGLEFQLASPEYITFIENGASFILPDDTEISFMSQNPGELQISGKFSDELSIIEIPLRALRSSVIRNGDNDMPEIMYSGNRYQFNRSLQTLESGQLALLVTGVTISYRNVDAEKEFNPADYIIPYAETVQSFSDSLSLWVSRNFALWARMPTQPDEDTVIAWCAEAIRQNTYRTAVSVIPVGFSSSPQRTWESGVYQFDRRIGVWERAVRAVSSFEREKANRISQLLTEKDPGVFAEKHLIEFLAVRGNNSLIENFISFAQEVNPASITLEMAPGILESCIDMNTWYPYANNPFEPLADQALQIISYGLHKAEEHVFVTANGHADTEYNLRLGMALHKWDTSNTGWAGLGRSLVLSVTSLSNDSGAVPATLMIEKHFLRAEEFVPSTEQISTAKLYRLLNNNEYLPHAAVTGTNMWAWTSASSVKIGQSNNQMNISITFPVGETHYVMVRNVPPFALLQIYDTNWRRAVDFESYYDASGWYYFEQERSLVLKIRQRSNVENVRIYFTAPRPIQPEPTPEQQETE